jgi:prolyl oligopeptidase
MYPESPRQESASNGEAWYGWADAFRWLEDTENATTLRWVEAQRHYTRTYLDKLLLRPGIQAFLAPFYRMERLGLPVEKNGWIFQSRQSETALQPVLLATPKGSLKSDTLIDPLQWDPNGREAFSGWATDAETRYFAVLRSSQGSDWNQISILDLKTRKWLPETITQVKFSGISWFKDGFFYSKFPQKAGDLNAANTNQQLFYHRLNTDPKSDVLVFQDKANPRRGVYASVSDDEKWLILSQSEGTSGNRLAVAALPESNRGSFSLNWLRIIDDEASDVDLIWSNKTHFFLLTNRNAPNKKLLKLKHGDSYAKAETVLAENSNRPLMSCHRWQQGWVAHYIDSVVSVLEFMPDDGSTFTFALPFLGSISGISVEEESPNLYVGLQSYSHPGVSLKWTWGAEKPELLHQPKRENVPQKVSLRQETFVGSDGASIPVFIMENTQIQGPKPCLLYGYGGFNIPILPFYKPWFHAFAEMGGMVVVPALRGGAEFGEKWHEEGMLLNKKRVFLDMEEAAEYLIKKGYTHSSQLAVHGRSNGGLLVGAVMTRRPDLFKVALPAVGVLDMMRYHSFTIGRAWMVEYGDPEKEPLRSYLKSYSPLHSIQPGQTYPATMILTADHDDRVVPSHSYKFGAALQSAANPAHPVLLRIDKGAGHGAGRALNAEINEAVDILSFLAYQLQLEFAPTAK